MFSLFAYLYISLVDQLPVTNVILFRGYKRKTRIRYQLQTGKPRAITKQ